MDEIKYIRHEVNNKDNSYADVARRMRRDPRTIKKYAEMEDFSPEDKPKQERPSPVMDPVKHIVDEWLLEDFKQKKKFRRTAKRIWELLKEGYGFKGSDRTVRNYISKRKEERKSELRNEKSTHLSMCTTNSRIFDDFYQNTAISFNNTAFSFNHF